MNRKLLNGLLVFGIAAGGVGTFTSCKDDNWHNQVIIDQVDLAAQINAIRQVTDTEFQTKLLAWLQANYPHVTKADVQQWMNEWTKEQGQANLETYPDVVKKLAALINSYNALVAGDYAEGSDGAKIANAMYEWLINNVFPDEEWYKQIWTNEMNIQTVADYFQNIINSQVTSIEINQTTNPVFGSINLPLGINTTVLATYQYNGASMNFPAEISISKLAQGAVTNPAQYEALQYAFQEIKSLSASSSKKVNQWDFTAPESPTMGNMGAAYVTLNPVGNDFSGVKLSIVNAKGETIIDNLEAHPYNDDLYFGVSRAENNVNVYEVPVNVVLGNEAPLAFHLNDKSGLKNAIKDLIKNKSVSDIGSLGRAIYDNMKDVLPAYALQVAWENDDLELATNDDAATRAGNTKKVLSKYELAATVVHPLSYTEPLADVMGDITGRQIPTIDPVAEYIQKIKNKLDITIKDVSLNINDVKVSLKVEVKDGKVWYEDAEGNIVGIPYEAGSITATDKDLTEFVNAVLEAASIEISNNVQSQMIDQLKASISQINEQLATVRAKIGDIQEYLDNISGSKKVEYAQKVVNKLNTVITKVNDFLADPNKYLQVLMAYDAGDGPHHASESAAGAVTIDASNATEKSYVALYVASYTGDVVVPSFKKYVAITKVMGDPNADLAALNEKAGLNKVMNGSELSIPLMVKGLAGIGVAQITYVSLDYRGNLSAQNYYFNFK